MEWLYEGALLYVLFQISFRSIGLDQGVVQILSVLRSFQSFLG